MYLLSRIKHNTWFVHRSLLLHAILYRNLLITKYFSGWTAEFISREREFNVKMFSNVRQRLSRAKWSEKIKKQETKFLVQSGLKFRELRAIWVFLKELQRNAWKYWNNPSSVEQEGDGDHRSVVFEVLCVSSRFTCWSVPNLKRGPSIFVHDLIGREGRRCLHSLIIQKRY